MSELDEPLAFLQLVGSIAHGLQSRSKRMEATLGVTGPQRLVVRIVGSSSGMASSDLARVLAFHPSTLTGILRRLEAKGYVVRQRDPADGRRALISLSAKGKLLNRVQTGTPEQIVRELFARTKKRDLAAAKRLLTTVAAAMNAND